MSEATLYARLGGYDAIAAVADNLVSRLMADERLGRFWAHRGTDGVLREKTVVDRFPVPQRRRPFVLHGSRYENRASGHAPQRS